MTNNTTKNARGSQLLYEAFLQICHMSFRHDREYQRNGKRKQTSKYFRGQNRKVGHSLTLDKLTKRSKILACQRKRTRTRSTALGDSRKNIKIKIKVTHSVLGRRCDPCETYFIFFRFS